jgi:4-oxalocrotonate tautomerase
VDSSVDAGADKEEFIPIAWPGKSEQLKRRLADKIMKDVMAVPNYGEESVSVAMEEVKPEDWTQDLYKPDIQGKWDKLYQKPGYDPF